MDLEQLTPITGHWTDGCRLDRNENSLTLLPITSAGLLRTMKSALVMTWYIT